MKINIKVASEVAKEAIENVQEGAVESTEVRRMKVSEDLIYDAFINLFYKDNLLTESECIFIRSKLRDEGSHALI